MIKKDKKDKNKETGARPKDKSSSSKSSGSSSRHSDKNEKHSKSKKSHKKDKNDKKETSDNEMEISDTNDIVISEKGNSANVPATIAEPAPKTSGDDTVTTNKLSPEDLISDSNSVGSESESLEIIETMS